MNATMRRRGARHVLGRLLLTVPLCAAPAFAQEPAPDAASRQAILDRARDDKSAHSAPQTRGRVEQFLLRYDDRQSKTIFGDWHGVHLAGGNFPAGAGLKFGVGLTRVIGATDPDKSNRIEWDSRAVTSTRGYWRIGTGVEVRNVGSAPIDVRVGGQFTRFSQEDFFGLGQDSDRHNRSNYQLESRDVGASVHWGPSTRVEIGGGMSYLNPVVDSGTDSRYPSTETIFDTRTLPAYDAQPNFLRADLTGAFDWTDTPLYPHVGGRYRATVSRFDDRDLHTFDFRRVEIDVQQYVPLPNRYRILAFRAAAAFSDTGAGDEVPFFYLPTLGGSQTLRGFRESRFRDRNSLVLTAEYRWEAWWALDGAFFIDAGMVGARRRDLSFRDMDVSYGVGFRLHSNRAFLARLDLAFSREGFIPLLRFEHVF